MSWETIMSLAELVRDYPSDNRAKDLAEALVRFNSQMTAGTRKLPASWRFAAAHLAGYETPR